MRAMLVNAGNANCATRTAEQVALETVRAAADMLRIKPHEVLPASTGVIGVELDAGITAQRPAKAESRPRSQALSSRG